MQGRFATGLHLALTNCRAPEQEDDLNQWYNDVHLREVTDTGVVTHPTRYRNVKKNLEPGQARYLALYESDWNDQVNGFNVIMTNARRLIDSGLMHSALEPVLGAQYSLIGPELKSARTWGAITGLIIVMTDCTDPSQEKEWNDWYNNVHAPDMLKTGMCLTAYRYKRVAPAGNPKYLALYEIDGAVRDVAIKLMEYFSDWKEDRYWRMMDVKMRGAFAVM